MKHKHYDCIVAWAEGKTIETRRYEHDEWKVVTNPQWYTSDEYRIKKEPVIEVKYFQILKTSMHERLNINYIEFQPDLEKWDLKITYQDGVAIKAEVAE